MGKDREIHGKKTICGIQFKDREGGKDFMLNMGVNETIGGMSMTSSVRWYDHVTRV